MNQPNILKFDQERDESLGEARVMTRQDFSTVFEEIKALALHTMAEKSALAPTVFLPSLAGPEIAKIGVMDVSPLVADSSTKDVLGGLINHMLTHPDHDFCVFAHEAWVLKADLIEGETQEQARERVAEIMRKNKSISEMPERQEALVFIVRSKTEQAMAMLPIVRDDDGDVVEIQPGEGLIFPDAASFSGRFTQPDASDSDGFDSAQNAPSTSTLQ